MFARRASFCPTPALAVSCSWALSGGMAALRVHSFAADLKKTSDKVARLEAKLARYDDDWAEHYPRAMAICTAQPPPPPPDAPFLRALQARGMSTKAFFEKLDRNGDGKVDKMEFRQTMRDLNLTADQLGTKEIDALFAQLDVDGSGELTIQELQVALQKWKVPKTKDGKPLSITMASALDDKFGPEERGARLVYLAERYEEDKRVREEKLAAEAETRKTKKAAEQESAAREEEAREEAKAAREAEWAEERKQLARAHQDVKRELEATKAEHAVEVTQLREAAEKMASKVSKAERDDSAELRVKLAERQRELDEAQERLKRTAAELESVTASRNSKTEEVAQTRLQREAGIAAAEARLQEALAALGKAESAAERGGYFFAAAPTKKNGQSSAQSSREGSPLRRTEDGGLAVAPELLHSWSVGLRGSPNRIEGKPSSPSSARSPSAHTIVRSPRSAELDPLRGSKRGSPQVAGMAPAPARGKKTPKAKGSPSKK